MLIGQPHRNIARLRVNQELVFNFQDIMDKTGLGFQRTSVGLKVFPGKFKKKINTSFQRTSVGLKDLTF